MAETTDKTKPVKTAIPEVGIPEPELPGVANAPADSEYTEGIYIKISDGEPYARADKQDAPDGKTVFAKNTAHFWNGTEAEFRAQFDKK